MKTKEFVKKVNELGYEVETGGHFYVSVKRTEPDIMIIASIDKRKQYKTFIFSVCEEEEDKAKELFKLCAEYARTPLKERQDTKRMKKSEFINKVKELGYDVCSDDIEVLIVTPDKTKNIARVQNKEQYSMETYMSEEEIGEDLFNLCTEYAQTPLEERKEEQKFYLKKIKSFYEIRLDEEFDFLNFDITRQVYCLNNTMGNAKFKTSFTQQEIDKIKEEQHTDLSGFKQIEVEE